MMFPKPADLRARAQSSAVVPVVQTSSTRAISWFFRIFRKAERLLSLKRKAPLRLALRSSMDRGLGAAEAGAFKGLYDRDAGLGAKGVSEILGLVETPGELPQIVQRDRDQGVNVGGQNGKLRVQRDKTGQGLGKVPEPGVLQSGNKIRDLAGIIGSGDDAGKRVALPALPLALFAEKSRLVQMGVHAGAAQTIGRFHQKNIPPAAAAKKLFY